MPQPKTLVPLADMLELLTQARERIAMGKPGIRANYASAKEAQQQFLRLGATFKRLQERSKELYDPADLRYGKHEYEDLAIGTEGSSLVIRSATIPRNVVSIEDL